MAQQSAIRGIVSIHNSQTETGSRQYVANAQIEDNSRRAQPVITDIDGRFVLIYVGIDEKMAVAFQVKKPGLEVVNIDALHAITGQNELVKISMASPDKIAAFRLKIYNIGRTEAEKRLEMKVSRITAGLLELQKKDSSDLEKIARLQQDLTILSNQRGNIEQQAQDLAIKYSRINLDDASPLFQEAFALFQMGQLDSALSFITRVNMANMVSRIVEERKKVIELTTEAKYRDSIQATRSRDIRQALLFKADIYATRYEFDSAAVCFKLMLQLDSTDYTVLFEYARLLQSFNHYAPALSYYSKTIDILGQDAISDSTMRPFFAKLKNNLAILYWKQNDVLRALSNGEESLAIYTQLVKTDSLGYFGEIAGIHNNLGNYYTDIGEFKKAEAAYLKALKISQRAAQADPQMYIPTIAAVQTDLGTLYQKTGDFDLAENSLLAALITCKKLDEIDHGSYVTLRARIDLALVYQSKKDFLRAEAVLLEAIAVFEEKARTGQVLYEPDLASGYLNLCALYIVMNNFPKAGIAGQKALDLFHQLALSEPLAYDPYVALVQSNLGIVYGSTDNFIKAETAFCQSLAIYEKLAGTAPEVYEPTLASMLSNLGAIYQNNDKYDAAETTLLKGIILCKKLVKADPQAYEPLLANMHLNISDVYISKNNTTAAKAHCLQGLTIYDRLRKVSRGVYEPDWAGAQINLGNCLLLDNRYRSAQIAFSKALDIYKRLEKNVPKVYDPNIASAQIGLAKTFTYTADYKHAENAYRNALAIYQLIAKDDPSYNSYVSEVKDALQKLHKKMRK
jgi:tetratricopeptide (TPR) repeat protein